MKIFNLQYIMAHLNEQLESLNIIKEFLSYGCKLTLVNSFFSIIPTRDMFNKCFPDCLFPDKFSDYNSYPGLYIFQSIIDKQCIDNGLYIFQSIIDKQCIDKGRKFICKNDKTSNGCAILSLFYPNNYVKIYLDKNAIEYEQNQSSIYKMINYIHTEKLENPTIEQLASYKKISWNYMYTKCFELKGILYLTLIDMYLISDIRNPIINAILNVDKWNKIGFYCQF